MGIPVFLYTNNLFAPVAASLMASITANTKAEVDFYILDGFISHGNKKRLMNFNAKGSCNVEFIKIDLKPYYKAYPLLKKLDSKLIFKYLIPDLKQNIGKAIYVDKDLVFLRGSDIAALYEMDMQEYAIAATKKATLVDSKISNHANNFIGLCNINSYLKYLGITDLKAIFDTSLLIFDCKRWHEGHVLEKAISLFENKVNTNQDGLLYSCDDMLFSYLDKKFLPLDRKWNVPFNYAKTFYLGQEFDNNDMCVLNFNEAGDEFKPYNNMKLAGSDFFWQYSKMTPFYRRLLKLPPPLQNP